MSKSRQAARQAWPSSATAKILLVPVLIVLFVLVNAVAALSVSRFSLKLDLTDARLYQFSAATTRSVQSLAAPIHITVFASEQDYPLMLREILDRYAALSERISVAYKDPFSNPVLVDSFVARGTRIEQNDLVVELGEPGASGARFRRFTIKDLYVLNNARTKVTGVRAEQQLTGAIVQLQSSRVPGVRFTDGHDEKPSKALIDLFVRNNYQSERVTLSLTGLDDQADIVVIAAPSRDFSAPETLALENHLRRGGSLMVFLAPGEKPLPTLQGFLERWGIVYGDALVLEPRAHISDNRLNIVPVYAPHEINAYFGDKRSFLLMPASRVLSASESASYDLDVMTVLSSTAEAYARQGGDSTTQEKSAGDLQGPFSLALTAVRKAATDASPARIFAAGSANLYADDVMAMTNFANADFLTQVILWLNPEQAAVNIPAKKIAADPLSILPGEAAVAGLLLGGAIPLLILVAGVVVSVRRRRAR
ncbi:MAG: GldG family protein [Propionivibrio sp.]